MVAFGFLLLQAASSVTPSPSDTTDGRLLRLVPPQHCTPSPDEIVVCATHGDAYRLPSASGAAGKSGPPKAEWKLFGDARIGLHGEQRTLPNGMSAPAAMATIKIPF